MEKEEDSLFLPSLYSAASIVVIVLSAFAAVQMYYSLSSPWMSEAEGEGEGGKEETEREKKERKEKKDFVSKSFAWMERKEIGGGKFLNINFEILQKILTSVCLYRE